MSHVLDVSRGVNGALDFWGVRRIDGTTEEIEARGPDAVLDNPTAHAWLYVTPPMPEDGVDAVVTLTSLPKKMRTGNQYLALVSTLTPEHCVAEGSARELWPLFFAHARMLL